MSERDRKSPVYLLRRIEWQRLVPLGILVVFAAIVGSFNPRFLGFDNLSNLSGQIAPSGIAAVGIMVVILSGGIDFSPAYGVALGVVTAGVVFGQTESAVLSIATAFGVGLGVGAVNGILVTKGGIQPFITTLGTLSITQGLTLIVSQGKIVFIRHPLFQLIGSGRLAGIPVAFFILLAVYVAASALLRYTKLGVYAYAMGDNEQGAILAGVNIDLYKFLLYVFSGACMALSAVVLMSRISMVAASVAGVSLLLDAIAAIILGGTRITGGYGTVIGTLVGVLLVGMIGNALNLLNVPAVAQDVFKGGVIIIALITEMALTRRRTKTAPEVQHG